MFSPSPTQLDDGDADRKSRVPLSASSVQSRTPFDDLSARNTMVTVVQQLSHLNGLL